MTMPTSEDGAVCSKCGLPCETMRVVDGPSFHPKGTMHTNGSITVSKCCRAVLAPNPQQPEEQRPRWDAGLRSGLVNGWIRHTDGRILKTLADTEAYLNDLEARLEEAEKKAALTTWLANQIQYVPVHTAAKGTVKRLRLRGDGVPASEQELRNVMEEWCRRYDSLTPTQAQGDE